jgi:hypothetical protein
MTAESFRLTSPYAATDPKAKRRKIGVDSTARWIYFADGEAYTVRRVWCEASVAHKVKIDGVWSFAKKKGKLYTDSLEDAFAWLARRINEEVKAQREVYDRRVAIRDRVLKEQKTALKMGELPPERHVF